LRCTMTTNVTAHSRGLSLVWSVPADEPPRLVDWPARSRGISLGRSVPAGEPPRSVLWPARSRRASLVRSAVFRAARLSIFGLIGWLLFVSAADSAWRVVSLAAALALAALVGITWYLSRLRAERRWRAALDAYAKREEPKRTNSRRNIHARPQSQDR
jgi:hypothetical protein